MISRRNFLARWLAAVSVILTGMFLRPSKVIADIDHFSGTDFVGKTRVGEHESFYINYWKPMRRIQPLQWKLEVRGLCKNPATFTLKEIKSLPVKTRTSRLKCVECWSARAEWQGFSIKDLEEKIQPLPEATGVLFHCADTYQEYLPRESLMRPETLLAYNMDGKPLTDEHGFPLRVIVPFKYGYKNPKAILTMEYVADVKAGTWSKIGPYSMDGTILPGIDHPLDLGKKPHRIPGGEILDY
ncbi:MAG: molybdopterin-dependent oxidoreductase [Nitrospinae bacterium]|nr:molybdopterin-dependent oxidoreductase [Nitrospinota bacterium]MDA1110671.1 molybdopterin-dependent oxidoreductase [Nitrospinota bacterium]